MRILAAAIGAVALLAAIVAVQAQQAGPPQPGHGPAMGPGQGRGPGHGLGRGQRGRARMGRWYIEPTPESRKLWEQLGQLQVQLHKERWRFFELVAQDQPDRDKIKAQLKKIAQIQRQMREVMRQLAKYRKPLPFRRGPVRALGGGEAEVQGQPRGGR